MFKRIIMATAVVAAMAMALPASGQEWRSRIEAQLEQKATFEFADMALADITQLVASQAKFNIVLDTGPGGLEPTTKLTATFKEMSYESILTWIARMVGAEWVVQNEAIFIASIERLDEPARLLIARRAKTKRSRAQKVWLDDMRATLAEPRSVQLRSTRIEEVADALEALMKINVILSSQVNRRTVVSLAVKDMTSENIIAWVARNADLDYVITDEAVYFAPADEIRAIRNVGLDYSARGQAFNLVSFAFQDTPLDQAFEELQEKTGVRIVLQCDLESFPRVTLSGSDMTLAAALGAVTRATGLNSVINTDAGTVYVSIMSPPEEKEAAKEEPAEAKEETDDDPPAENPPTPLPPPHPAPAE